MISSARALASGSSSGLSTKPGATGRSDSGCTPARWIIPTPCRTTPRRGSCCSSKKRFAGSFENMTTYTHILDLAKEAEPPADGILSRTIFQDDQLKAIVFGFSRGQELSEHTAAKPALLIFVQGEAAVGLGDDVQEARTGTLVHMSAGLRHSIKAKTPVVMLLLLLR